MNAVLIVAAYGMLCLAVYFRCVGAEAELQACCFVALVLFFLVCEGASDAVAREGLSTDPSEDGSEQRADHTAPRQRGEAGIRPTVAEAAADHPAAGSDLHVQRM